MAGRPRRILIVDDNERHLLLCRTILEAEGFDVSEAYDGEDALRAAWARKPDLILLDILMPDKDGFDCLAEFREDSALRDIPVVMVSGVDDDDTQRRSFEAGAVGFVAKPVEPGVLLEVVRLVLERHEADAQSAP